MKHPIDQSTIYEDAFTYDQIHHAKSLGKDTHFYHSLAKNNQKVLEVACGTGRMTIPLSKAGLDITGLDLSESMLKEAHLKAKQSNRKINWIHADCTNFSLIEKFGLIFMTGNSLQHLYLHLGEGGIIFHNSPF